MDRQTKTDKKDSRKRIDRDADKLAGSGRRLIVHLPFISFDKRRIFDRKMIHFPFSPFPPFHRSNIQGEFNRPARTIQTRLKWPSSLHWLTYSFYRIVPGEFNRPAKKRHVRLTRHGCLNTTSASCSISL